MKKKIANILYQNTNLLAWSHFMLLITILKMLMLRPTCSVDREFYLDLIYMVIKPSIQSQCREAVSDERGVK